jgi:hypothetical protein
MPRRWRRRGANHRSARGLVLGELGHHRRWALFFRYCCNAHVRDQVLRLPKAPNNTGTRDRRRGEVLDSGSQRLARWTHFLLCNAVCERNHYDRREYSVIAKCKDEAAIVRRAVRRLDPHSHFGQTVGDKGGDFVIVPYTFHMNDIVSLGFEGWNPLGYEQALRDEIDQLYEEGATRRRMMVISLHDRISGHAGRVRVLDRSLFTRRTSPAYGLHAKTRWQIGH